MGTINTIIKDADRDFGIAILENKLKQVEKNIHYGLTEFGQPVNTDQHAKQLKTAIDIMYGAGAYFQIEANSYPIKFLKQERWNKAKRFLEKEACRNDLKLKEMYQSAVDRYDNIINWLAS